MPKKGLLKGPKFSGRHTTLNAVATDIVSTLRDLTEVKKITIGPIQKTRNGQKRVKLTVDGYVVKAQCRDVTSVQLLWIHAPLTFCQNALGLEET